RSIGDLMYAANFCIAFLSEDGQSIHFPYFAQLKNDARRPQSGRDYPLQAHRHTPVWYVLTEGRALMGDPAEIARQVRGPLQHNHTAGTQWLGVPLRRGHDTIGALVVFSQQRDAGYRHEDKALLTYVAQHVQTALERHQARLELNRRVAERTQ